MLSENVRQDFLRGANIRFPSSISQKKERVLITEWLRARQRTCLMAILLVGTALRLLLVASYRSL